MEGVVAEFDGDGVFFYSSHRNNAEEMSLRLVDIVGNSDCFGHGEERGG